MAKKPGERVARMVADVEKAAKKLRGDVRKRAKAAPMLKSMQKAAEQLRKRAATAAGQVEKYLHDIRLELEGAVASKPTARRRKATRVRRKRAAAVG
jgi:hypothetical protein